MCTYECISYVQILKNKYINIDNKIYLNETVYSLQNKKLKKSFIGTFEDSKFVQSLYSMSIAKPKIDYDNKIYLNCIIHKKVISNIV